MIYPTIHARPGRQTMQNVQPHERVPFEALSPMMLMDGNRRIDNERRRTAPVRH